MIVGIGVGPWYWLLSVDFFDNHAALLARATGTVAEKRITGKVVLGILLCLGIFGTFERDSPTFKIDAFQQTSTKFFTIIPKYFGNQFR